MEAVADARVDSVLRAHKRERAELIPILQEVQAAVGFLPEDVLRQVARHLRISAAEVFGVATFFAQFRLSPRGKNLVRVCRGTACHVRGGAGIRKAVEDVLGVTSGETTPDMKFTYETIACIGACGLAPVMAVEGTTHGEMTPALAREALAAASDES